MQPKPTGKPTLADVAAAAGVSTAAVSYVLRGKQGGCAISPKTAEKILRAAADLHYRPDETARALAALRQAPLRLLVFTPWLYAQFSDFMARLFAALDREGVEVRYLPYHTSALQQTLRPAHAGKADVLLVVGTSQQDEQYLTRHRSRYPNLLLLNRDVPAFPCVRGNDRAATLALLSPMRGRYPTGCILHSPAPSNCEKERIAAFFSLYPQGRVLSPRDLLSPPEQAEGVLYFSPQYVGAARLLRWLTQAGVSVPAQAGVAAYDVHSLLQDFTHLPLCTVDPDIAGMAEAALGMAQALRAGETPATVTVPARPVPGRSALTD